MSLVYHGFEYWIQINNSFVQIPVILFIFQYSNPSILKITVHQYFVALDRLFAGHVTHPPLNVIPNTL